MSEELLKSLEKKRPFKPLKKKLLFAVILVSTLFTSVVVFFHFKFEYNDNITDLDKRILQINQSLVPSMVSASWQEDRGYLNVQAESIISIRDIIKVTVTDSNGIVIVEKDRSPEGEGQAIEEDKKIFRFPLIYKGLENSKDYYLGELTITASTSKIKNEIYRRLVFFVFAQFIKTFLISWIILLIFHQYINKNLQQIVDFFQSFNLNSIDENYLKIQRHSKSEDEIDLLQDSINRMIKKIRHLNLEKEQKITEQEKKIEVQKMSAIASSKMAALGEMAGGIAHEINSPLTVIHTKTKTIEKMIERGIPDNELFLKNTQSIIGTVDKISNVIQGLQNISKDASHEEKKDVVIRGLLENILNLCEEKFRNHHIDIQCDLNAPYFQTHLNCYQTQLSQVFLILLNNSFDAIEEQTEQDALGKQKDKWIKIDASQNKKWYYLHFIDSGPGIPKEIVEKMFQPFFTTKEIGKGSGLGLSLAYEIITKHGGEIFYDDHYQNTCFTIKLLLKERKSILVVDDDIDIREAICGYLKLEGYETIEASNGKEALEIVRDKKIEFVVSDIRMPDGGGLFLLDELRKIDRVLPYVILVTGQADITREEAIKRGALDMLKKPLEMERIVGLIKFIENSYDDFIEV